MQDTGSKPWLCLLLGTACMMFASNLASPAAAQVRSYQYGAPTWSANSSAPSSAMPSSANVEVPSDARNSSAQSSWWSKWMPNFSGKNSAKAARDTAAQSARASSGSNNYAAGKVNGAYGQPVRRYSEAKGGMPWYKRLTTFQLK